MLCLIASNWKHSSHNCILQELNLDYRGHIYSNHLQHILSVFLFIPCRMFCTCRKRRKLFAMKKQARERMQAGGGATADGGDAELFALNNIKSKKVMQVRNREEFCFWRKLW